MQKRFHPGWNWSFVSIIFSTLLLSGLIAGELAQPEAVFAEACGGGPCFQGRITYQPNYGSAARISTPDPAPRSVNAGSDGLLSFMFINSQTPLGQGTQMFIQTGWFYAVNYFGNNCGGGPRLFWEFIDFNTVPASYQNGCTNTYPGAGSTHSYGQQYDANTAYWCHLYDGNCFKSEPAFLGDGSTRSVGTNRGTQVAAYGETTDSRIQMGGLGYSKRATISRIEYKSNSTGSFSAFTVPPYVLSNYGTCNISVCEYRSNSGGASGDGNRWYVEVWTDRLY